MLPVLRQRSTQGVPVSVDTAKPEVMRAALDAGAEHHQRRARACSAPGALDVLAAIRLPACVPHAHAGRAAHDAGDAAVRRRGGRGARLPRRARWLLRARAASRAERIVLDPGFGFGKTRRAQLDAAARQRECSALGAAAAGRACRASDARRDHRPRRWSGWRPAWRRRLLAVQRGAPNRARARRRGDRSTRWRSGAQAGRINVTKRDNMSRTQYFGTDGIRGTVGRRRSRPISCCAWATPRARCSQREQRRGASARRC